MSWLSEFGQIVHAAAMLARPAELGAAEAALLGGDPTRLVEAFPDGVRIDDPRLGTSTGSAELLVLCEQSSAWYQQRQSHARLVATTSNERRVVGEFEVELTQEGRSFVLPVAVVVEPASDGRSVWIRVYHSLWPLLGHHRVRPPLLDADPAARESDVVGEYQAALAAGDAERILATFEPDGCFREPAGPQYRRCGMDELRDFFGAILGAGGGIILEHCTVTEDGTRSALEFNAIRWGHKQLPPQAGIAVYERGTSGRLSEARIYDDVEGPLE